MHTPITVTAATLRTHGTVPIEDRIAAGEDVYAHTPATITVTASELRQIAAATPDVFLVLGCGASSTPAIQDADQDEENWIVARVVHAPALAQTEQRPNRWCVLVSGVAPSILDRDRSVIAYRTINDFDLALGACRGVQPDDFASIELAMIEAGAIE